MFAAFQVLNVEFKSCSAVQGFHLFLYKSRQRGAFRKINNKRRRSKYVNTTHNENVLFQRKSIFVVFLMLLSKNASSPVGPGAFKSLKENMWIFTHCVSFPLKQHSFLRIDSTQGAWYCTWMWMLPFHYQCNPRAEKITFLSQDVKLAITHLQ